MFDLGRTLVAAAARNGNAIALVDGTKRFTYAQLLEVCSRAVIGFDRIGLKRGDHLFVVSQNRAEMAIAHWASQVAGLVVTPVNWRVGQIELDYLLENSASKAVIFDPAAEKAIGGSARARGLRRISVAGATGGDIGFDELIDTGTGTVTPRASASDTSLLLYTSGTTGQGKGVPRRHHAERAAALAHVAQNAYLTGETTLGVMPLYHTMGVRILLAMALINGVFVCLPRFDAAAALEVIETERISSLYLVPTLYYDLLSHGSFSTTDISSVRKIGFAGAPMTDGLLKRLNAAFTPDVFVNHYGSTEVYTFTVNQAAAKKPGSAGKAGINSEVRVVKLGSSDPQDVVSQGEDGQVIASLASDEAFEGYWRRPDADAKALHGGWYFTGDIGYLDRDGDLFITGRVDDMMISGGENVLPIEIESVLSLHPGVAEIAVAGVPDERWGHRITAYVRRNWAVSAEDLEAWCRQSHLTNFKCPRAYVFVESIPKSPVGKILRNKLVQGNYQSEASK